MFTDIDMRGPFIDADTSIVLANNIALNSNTGAHISMNTYDQPTKKFLVTCVGYLCISGPDTSSSTFGGMRIHSNAIKTPPAGSVLWVDGLYSMKGPTATVTPLTYVTTIHTEQVDSIVDITKVARPVDIPDAPVKLLSADDIFNRAVANIGPRPKDRIPNLTRKIKHLSGKTGKLVNHETDTGVGGPTDIAKTTRVLDGTTKFSDGTVIPAYPTVSATPTAAEKAAVRAWLEKFLTRLQYD